MKVSPIVAAALFAASLPAYAQLSVVDSNYSVTPYYADPLANNITGFDWDGTGALDYMTTDSSGYESFTGVYSFSGGPTGVNTTIDGGIYPSENFVGNSVVALGNYVYYNYSDYSENEYINQFDPTIGSASVGVSSTAENWGLYKNNGQLFITGAGSDYINHIFVSTPGSNGNLTTVTDLGATGDSSGPLAFDSAGDLFYAPGYGNPNIYKWTALQVAAAEANPTVDSLTETSGTNGSALLWVSYGSNPAYSAYASYGGATSMLVESDGDVLVTLNATEWYPYPPGGSTVYPSDLVDFSDNGSTATTILTDTSALMGDIAQQSGTTYVADGSQIDTLQVVPEPSAMMLLALGGLGAGVIFLRRKSKALA